MLEKAIRLVADHPAPAAGLVILAGLAIEVCILILGGILRILSDRRRSALECRRLEVEIEKAKLAIKAADATKSAWNGVRKFSVVQKVMECADTYSFTLKPHDGKALPHFKPGQYLTFQLNVPGLGKPLVRCYSLSDCARRTHYRVTIKRCPPPSEGGHPPGVGSSFFCDSVKVGDILDVKAPNGHFHLDLEGERPVVLISGGVGVTPMVSMANALVESGSTRDIWFFHGARNGSDHMFKAYMQGLASDNKGVKMHVCYSRPSADDVKGRDYHHESRVTVDLLKELLPSSNFEYFLCGPGAFMESITEDLRKWGVPDNWVHFEAFGPASVKRAATPESKVAVTFAPFGGIEVTFARSGRKVAWQGGGRSLLELAEEANIKIDAGCRAGNCGSCLVAIKSGTVEYITEHGADVEEGSCLACICRPSSALVVDA
jgi:ferredoxin-NADP reductase